MKFTGEELATLESIPAGKKRELLQFARFLAEDAGSSDSEADAATKVYRRCGLIKGKIWMSDDFNDPIAV